MERDRRGVDCWDYRFRGVAEAKGVPVDMIDLHACRYYNGSATNDLRQIPHSSTPSGLRLVTRNNHRLRLRLLLYKPFRLARRLLWVIRIFNIFDIMSALNNTSLSLQKVPVKLPTKPEGLEQ